MSGTELKETMSGKYMQQISALNKQAITLRHNWREETAKLEEENKKLNEQNECVKRQIESVCEANDKLKEEMRDSLNYWTSKCEIAEDSLKKVKEELKRSNTALQMVKEENEVNKKNMFRFMEENKQYKEAESLLLVQPNPEAFAEKIKELKQQVKQEEMYLSAVEVLKFMDHEWDEEGKGWIQKEENESEEEELKQQVKPSRDKVRELVEEYFEGETESSNPAVSTNYTIYDWYSEEESEEEE